MKTELKIYVYHVKDDFIKNINLEIYAINKNQADQLMELYKKKTKDTIKYIGISKNKDSMARLKVYINKFNGIENLIKAQFKLFEIRG